MHGRDDELERVRAALDTARGGDAYVTLVGAPGMGKRTLVRAALVGVPHVWLACSDAAMPSIDAGVAARWVAEGAHVVVLDGSDRVAEGDAHRVAALASSAGLVVLATATRPMGLPAEQLVRVGPLDADAAVAMLEALLRRHGGTVPGRERLAQLADQLHRHPGAITLAAPRLCTLGPELVTQDWVLQELGPGLARLLRDLSPAEHRAVAALSVLPASAPREVVLRIVSATSSDGASLLHALVWRSLVIVDERERLTLAPWLREHVRAEGPALPEDEERALEALVHHAPRAGDALRAHGRTELASLEALMVANTRFETAVEALTIARWAWLARTTLATGVELTSRVIARTPEDSVPWLRAMLVRVQLEYMRGHDTPTGDLERLWTTARQLGRKDLEGSAHLWGFYARMNGALDAAVLAEQAAACDAEFGPFLSASERGRLHAFRGYLAARLCDPPAAIRHHRAAVELSMRDGDLRLARDGWNLTGSVATTSGDYREARHALNEAERINRATQEEPSPNHIACEVIVLLGEKRMEQAREVVNQSVTNRTGSFHDGFFWGMAGLVRFLHGERDEARISFERASQTPDARPSMRACWLLWLAILHAESGASIAAADTFDEAGALIRQHAELQEVMLDLEAIFAVRIFGSEGAVRRSASWNAAESASTLRAALAQGRAPLEARLALLGLGLDDVVPTLRLDAACAAFELGEVRGSFGNGSPQRAVLRALTDAHRRAPGVPSALDALIAAAWPGEKLVGDSGANRLRVAVSRLRKAGLGELIIGHPGGYALSHSLRLESLASNDE